MSPTRGKNFRNVAISTQFSHFGRLLCPSPFTYQPGPNLAANNIQAWSTITRQISFESVACVTFRGQKPNFWQMVTFGGSCTQPFINKGQILCAEQTTVYTLTCQISSPSVYFIALWRRNPQIFPLFGVTFSGVGSWQQSEKVERGCSTANLLLSNGIKTVSVLQQLHDKIVVVSIYWQGVTPSPLNIGSI